MDTGDWISAGIALLALVAAVWGLVYARKSATASATSATAGQRSAAAAEESAAYGHRSAEAAERSAAAAEALVPAAPPPVIWQLELGSKSLHLLRNMGSQPATDVTVTGLPPDAAELVRVTPAPRVGVGETLEVTILRVMGPTVTSLEVRCAEITEPVVVPVR